MEDDTITAVLDLPDWWTVPDDESLQDTYGIHREQGKGNLHYLFTEVSNGYDRMFDGIEYILSTNLEVERIKELFKQKVDELKKVFVSYPYDDLATLEFAFRKKKGLVPAVIPQNEPEEATETEAPEPEEEVVKPLPKPKPKPKATPKPKPAPVREPAPQPAGNDLLAYAESMASE